MFIHKNKKTKWDSFNNFKKPKVCLTIVFKNNSEKQFLKTILWFLVEKSLFVNIKYF